MTWWFFRPQPFSGHGESTDLPLAQADPAAPPLAEEQPEDRPASDDCEAVAVSHPGNVPSIVVEKRPAGNFYGTTTVHRPPPPPVNRGHWVASTERPLPLPNLPPLPLPDAPPLPLP